MIKRMLSVLTLSLCSLTAMADCNFSQSDSNKTYVLEEQTKSGIKYNIYFNNELKYRTRYASVSDEYNVYKKGEQRIKIEDMKFYELCVSPREA